VLVAFVCALTSLPAWSATVRVPADYPSIQEGIAAAASGDEVLIAPGTYTGPGNWSISYEGKEITVRSESGPDDCIIDCQGRSHFITFEQDEGPGSVLEGLTILGSSGSAGGVVSVIGTSPVFRNCVFQYGFGTMGGVVAASEGAAPLFDSCAFLDSWAINGGAAMLMDGASITFIGCRFDGNHSEGYIEEDGGVIFCHTGTSASFYGCLIQNNYSAQYGGVVSCWFETHVVMNDSIFINNRSSQGGGVAAVWFDSVFEMNNCLLIDNFSDTGGAIYSFEANPVLRNCTFSGNECWMAGSAAFTLRGSITAVNCIFWGNLVDDVYAWDGELHIRNSNCQMLQPGPGNISTDPLFAAGPRGEYYLSQTAAGQDVDSPCIDAGLGMSDATCFSSDDEDVCLNRRATRTDAVGDAGRVDMGFHYPADFPAPNRVGVRLQMPALWFSPGHTCGLDALLDNNGEPLPAVPVVVLLEVNGVYWFWDSWTQAPDAVTVDVPSGTTALTVLPQFTWPDTGDASATQLEFWGAMLSEDWAHVLGGFEGIGQWTFGFGPA